MDEAALLEVPANLLKGQVRGILSIFPSQLRWVPDDLTQAEPFDVATSAIADWQKAKGKPYLRLVASSKPFVLEFADEATRDLVERTLTPFISATADPAKTAKPLDPHYAYKQRLLQQEADLKTVYESLVKTGALTEDDFWQPKLQALEKAGGLTAPKEQSLGLPSTPLPDILEAPDGSDVLNLTPALVLQIFAEMPHVRRAYDRHVPTDMDEKEFWLRYSRHQAATKKKRRKVVQQDVQGAQEIDDEFADLFIEQRTDAEREEATDQTIDLVSDERMTGDGLGYGQHRRELSTRGGGASGPSVEVADMGTEMNRHAAVVLNGLTNSSPHRRPLEHQLDDGGCDHLMESGEESYAVLHLSKRQASDGAGAHPFDHDVMDSTVAPTVAPPILETEAIPALSATSVKVLSELYCGGEGREDDPSNAARGVSPADGLPLEILETLRKQVLIVNELLRHFWASYPINSSTKEAKITKIRETVISHFDSMKRLRSRASSPRESALIQQLLRPIQAQINAASDKFTTELESRQKHMHQM